MSSEEHVAFRTPTCERCGAEQTYRDCWNCGGEGNSYHDCGQDTCCCLDPEDNVECDICEGDGGWWACPFCNPDDDA